MTAAQNVENAARSLGQSVEFIYERVHEILIKNKLTSAQTICDVGCGKGYLGVKLSSWFPKIIGLDLIRYEGLPSCYEFKQSDFNSIPLPVQNASCDLVLAIEVIEHVENPRALVREFARMSKKGGFILISTPNQLSLLSKLTLIFKNQFNAFQSADYPAHISALLLVDLKRISMECGLQVSKVYYSKSSRVPFTRFRYPRMFSEMFPQLLSDNVFVLLQK